GRGRRIRLERLGRRSQRRRDRGIERRSTPNADEVDLGRSLRFGGSAYRGGRDDDGGGQNRARIDGHDGDPRRRALTRSLPLADDAVEAEVHNLEAPRRSRSIAQEQRLYHQDDAPPEPNGGRNA